MTNTSSVNYRNTLCFCMDKDRNVETLKIASESFLEDLYFFINGKLSIGFEVRCRVVLGGKYEEITFEKGKRTTSFKGSTVFENVPYRIPEKESIVIKGYVGQYGTHEKYYSPYMTHYESDDEDTIINHEKRLESLGFTIIPSKAVIRKNDTVYIGDEKWYDEIQKTILSYGNTLDYPFILLTFWGRDDVEVFNLYLYKTQYLMLRDFPNYYSSKNKERKKKKKGNIIINNNKQVSRLKTPLFKDALNQVENPRIHTLEFIGSVQPASYQGPFYRSGSLVGDMVQVKEWLKPFKEEDRFTIIPEYQGLPVTFSYQDGKLISILQEGRDFMFEINSVMDYPKQIDYLDPLDIVGIFSFNINISNHLMIKNWEMLAETYKPNFILTNYRDGEKRYINHQLEKLSKISFNKYTSLMYALPNLYRKEVESKLREMHYNMKETTGLYTGNYFILHQRTHSWTSSFTGKDSIANMICFDAVLLEE